MFREALRGQVVGLQIESQRRFSAPKLGAARAASNLSAVTGLATQGGKSASILLVNKSPNAEARVTVKSAQAINGPWAARAWNSAALASSPASA